MPAYASSVPPEQHGAYDPDDPNGERGLLATGGKIALGVGAAVVAYNAYNQFQQHQHNQQQQQQPNHAYTQSQQYPHTQQPPQPHQQMTYGGAPPAAFGGNSAHQSVAAPPPRRGVFTIYLDRLANLANKDFLSKSDPYVKLSIEQDNWIRDLDHGQQISARKTDDLNPVYNEVFHFNLPTLKNMVLKVQVMDDDGGVTSDDKMGACKIKLWELGLNAVPQPVERVIDRNVFSNNGTCHLRLAYSG